MIKSELLRAPVLGIEFWQNDKRCPIFMVNDRYRIKVQLNPQPFEMRFPRIDSIYAVGICAARDENIFFQTDRPYFSSGTGMADSAYSVGTLFLDENAHNHLDIGGRLLVETGMGRMLFSSFFESKRTLFEIGMQICLVVKYFPDSNFGFEEVILDFQQIEEKPSFPSQNAFIPNIVNNRKTIKIFLASSSELLEDRKEFELMIGRKNKELNVDNIFLELIIWEDFIDSVSKTRLQDEYNKKIQECDIFVSLYFTKVGKFTKEEFTIAHNHFLNTEKPLIYTYFKNAALKSRDIVEKDFRSKSKFLKHLNQLGHFPTYYEDSNDLKLQFTTQFRKIKDLIL